MLVRVNRPSNAAVSYLTKRFPHVIWLDTEKFQKRVELENPIHHRSAGQTPSVGSPQAVASLCGFSIPILDTLGFVENDAVKDGFCRMKQRKFVTCFVIEVYVVIFVVLDELLTPLQFLGQSTVSGDYDVVLEDFFNRRFLPMVQKH